MKHAHHPHFVWDDRGLLFIKWYILIYVIYVRSKIKRRYSYMTFTKVKNTCSPEHSAGVVKGLKQNLSGHNNYLLRNVRNGDQEL